MKTSDRKSWLSASSILPISRICSTSLMSKIKVCHTLNSYRIIGFARGQLATFIIEYRQDAVGEFVWVVTAWRSTLQEQKACEQETQ